MAFENQYSILDRTLHYLAFKSWPVQAAISDIEDRLFKAELDNISIEKPVFITALPRAGTTLLLGLCVSQGEFTSHSYRDMPFILSPMLWHKFSTKFQQSDAPRERAHGDGMLVNVDSPEAFEEVVWRTFWKSHYKKDHIVPWSDESDPEFYKFLNNHLTKIIAIHSETLGINARYVSKNNLNIARIDALLTNFNDAVIIVPFREPLQHAASLLKQHRNFLKIHSQDKFARSYMAAIGHYDFGENLKPINFDNWLNNAVSSDTNSLTFWLEYWLASYRHLLSKSNGRLRLLSYEAFCEDPSTGLDHLCEVLEIKNRDSVLKNASTIKAAKPHPVNIGDIDKEVLKKVHDLYDELVKVSFV